MDCEKKFWSHVLKFKQHSYFCGSIGNTADEQQTALVFGAEVNLKRKALFESINAVFNTRGFTAFKTHTGYDLSDSNLDYSDDLFLAIWNSVEKGGLQFKAGYALDSALDRLFEDWWFIHYTVKSGNDEIDQMSPGKKALVLLELIISLEVGKCPILIDQPEDDLDNRSIYNDLVQFIRNKKRERQIIVVTHNANVVVGADAEQVIIANQDGIDTPNSERRFEYRSGSIENDSKIEGVEGVLYTAGIQTQICNILEGGKKAFELRKNKYMIHD